MKTAPPTSSETGTGFQTAVPAKGIALRGIGLTCKAGDQSFALFGAVATHLTNCTPHNHFSGKGENGEGIRLLLASIPELEGCQTPQERITSLAESALKQALSFLPQDMAGEKILVLTLLPEVETDRGASLNHELLQSALQGQDDNLTTACFRFASPDQGAVLQLEKACAELAGGKWQYVIFGGADSLVDIVTCASLIQTKSAMLREDAGGVILGEGAAYLLLEKCDPSNPPTGCPIIGAMTSCEEPYAGKAEDHQMTGLTTALRNILTTANLSAPALQSIVLPLDGNIDDELEWHQTVENNWSRRENIPRKFEELRPYISLGKTGAATIPLALVLGAARFDFRFPSVDNIVVVESSQHSHRGTVYLKMLPSREKIIDNKIAAIK